MRNKPSERSGLCISFHNAWGLLGPASLVSVEPRVVFQGHKVNE